MQISESNPFKTSIDKLVKLNEEEWNAMNAFLIERSFKKGTYLCRHGQTENYLSIIQSGSCRGYYSKDAEEVSVAFMFSGDYVSAYYSFLTQKPSLMAIQALTDVTVVSIHKRDLEHLCDKYKSAERIGRLNAERIYRRKEEREISLLTLSASERYQELLMRYPQILQHIPLKHIASYLGIQPESLSRIRKNLLNK